MSFDLASRLASRRAEDLYRQRPLLESAQGPDVVVDGQPLLAFCSNDYLGLANHPEVIAALRAGAERWGVGGGASHLVVGHSGPHHELELALAEFTGRPRALLFSTGYMANLGAVTALVGKGDTVLEDRLNHASLLDAGLLSGARFRATCTTTRQASPRAWTRPRAIPWWSPTGSSAWTAISPTCRPWPPSRRPAAPG